MGFNLISITDYERKKIQKKAPAPRNRLVMTGRGKKANNRSYYIMANDRVSLNILAELRGMNVKTLLEKYN